MHYAGDAVLAKFDAVMDAISAAITIQNELKAHNSSIPDEKKLQFRIGVNSGDVIEDRGDIYGDGVNIAARLEVLADPGGICIFDAVRAAIGKKFSLHYEDLGEQSVKNIAEPVRAYKVMEQPDGDSVTAVRERSTVERPDRPSIAVLLNFSSVAMKRRSSGFKNPSKETQISRPRTDNWRPRMR